MMVPGYGPAFDDYNYEQSSNRMPIEQAWGEVVARWGVLWRPLRCAYKRRAAVIAACIRLHNICVESRIKLTYNEVNGLVQLSENRWERPPRFDRDGRPVEYLDKLATWRAWTTAPPPGSGKARRLQICREIARLGLKRPPRRKLKFK